MDNAPWNFPSRKETAARLAMKSLVLAGIIPAGAMTGAIVLPLKAFTSVVKETWNEELMFSGGDTAHAARHCLIIGSMVIFLSPGISLAGSFIGATAGALIVIDKETRQKITPDLHARAQNILFAFTTPNLS